MIPKIIHSIWWQGFDFLPEKYKKNVASVIEHNPDWQYVQWSEKSITTVVSSLGKQYLDKLNSFPHMHQKIDFGRYVILYIYGGVSVDTDAMAYKSFNDTPYLDTSDFIASYNSYSKLENYIKAGVPKVIINATILVSERNPILKSLLDRILTLNCKINESKRSCIQETTGPHAFTEYLFTNFKDQITILDNSYFDPCNGFDNECTLPKNAILDQQQEGSWLSDSNKKFARLYHFIKRRKNIIFIIVVIIAIIIIFKLLKT